MNKIIEQIEKIKQINSNENLVIFVGAGVSKNSGVCSWWELVKEIAEIHGREEKHINELINNNKIGKIKNAASIIQHKIITVLEIIFFLCITSPPP